MSVLTAYMDATETTARVELHSKCQTISVDRGRIAVINVALARAALARCLCMAHRPHYTMVSILALGYKYFAHRTTAPSHGDDGFRTPERFGAWNSTVSNTQAQLENF